MWPSTLSGRLPVNALVGHHPTNKLIGREPIPHQKRPFPTPPCDRARISRINTTFVAVSRRKGQVTHVLLTRSPLIHPQQKPRASPFDLHVLSTPPAFVLSQDQTLQTKTNQTPHQTSAALQSIKPRKQENQAQPKPPPNKQQPRPNKNTTQPNQPNPTSQNQQNQTSTNHAATHNTQPGQNPIKHHEPKQ